jgi:hypothetical protein
MCVVDDVVLRPIDADIAADAIEITGPRPGVATIGPGVEDQAIAGGQHLGPVGGRDVDGVMREAIAPPGIDAGADGRPVRGPVRAAALRRELAPHRGSERRGDRDGE